MQALQWGLCCLHPASQLQWVLGLEMTLVRVSAPNFLFSFFKARLTELDLFKHIIFEETEYYSTFC